jgi:hypothetical protein
VLLPTVVLALAWGCLGLPKGVKILHMADALSAGITAQHPQHFKA